MFHLVIVDIDGLGSSAIGGQFQASTSTQSPLPPEKNMDPSCLAGMLT